MNARLGISPPSLNENGRSRAAFTGLTSGFKTRRFVREMDERRSDGVENEIDGISPRKNKVCLFLSPPNWALTELQFVF